MGSEMCIRDSLFAARGGPGIRPRGQDIIDAFHEWSKDEIKKGVDRCYDLGKFLFSVSVGSVGVQIALFKSGTASGSSEVGLFLIALAVTGISGIVALYMVIPSIWPLKGPTDLAEEYVQLINRSRAAMLIWLAIWAAGLVLYTAHVAITR